MPKSVVEDGTPLHPEGAYAASAAMAVLRRGLGSRQEIEDELDGIAAAMRGFYLRPPDQVLRECSAYSARLTELCVLLYRVENLDRQFQRLRTMQVQRFIDELTNQHRIASRLIEVSRQDIALLGGLT